MARNSRLSGRLASHSDVPGITPEIQAAWDRMQEDIATLNAQIKVLAGPYHPPKGPSRVTPTIPGNRTIALTFRGDVGFASVRTYCVYRANAGTVASPTVPSAADAILVGTVAPVWRQNSPLDIYSFVDGTITLADRVAQTLFMYWVSSMDIAGRESSKIGSDVGAVGPVI